MKVPFEVHVALRYLLAKRKQAFISVISAISTLGVTVGVMALVIALALMTGLQQELRDRIVGSNPHIYVWNTHGIQSYADAAATPRKVAQGPRHAARRSPARPARPPGGARGDSGPGPAPRRGRDAADAGQGDRSGTRAGGHQPQGRDHQ